MPSHYFNTSVAKYLELLHENGWETEEVDPAADKWWILRQWRLRSNSGRVSKEYCLALLTLLRESRDIELGSPLPPVHGLCVTSAVPNAKSEHWSLPVLLVDDAFRSNVEQYVLYTNYLRDSTTEQVGAPGS